MAQGALAEAGESLQQALTLDPGNGPAYYQMGRLRHRQGKIESAKESLRTAIRLNTGDLASHQALAAILEAEGETTRAEREIKRALALKENDPVLLLTLARLLLVQGKNDAAWETLKQAAHRFPRNFDAQVRLVDWYYQNDGEDQPLGLYQAAGTLKPNRSVVRTRLE